MITTASHFGKVFKWTTEMMRDEQTFQYMDGMAFHWYFGGAERELDGSIGWGPLKA